MPILYSYNHQYATNFFSYNSFDSDSFRKPWTTENILEIENKEKFKLLLDSKSPISTTSVFVPPEDYTLILNSSSPIKRLVYSGVIISKIADEYEIKGYSRTAPYFKYYQ